jgi:hypothetical protein
MNEPILTAKNNFLSHITGLKLTSFKWPGLVLYLWKERKKKESVFQKDFYFLYFVGFFF